MKWEGEKDRFAVGVDRTIYVAKPDGTLEIRGKAWKECPLDMGRGYCRKNVREMGDKKCKNCLKSPVRGRLDSQEQAILVAEAIERKMSDETGQ